MFQNVSRIIIMRMRKECNYRLLVARKCLERRVLLYFYLRDSKRAIMPHTLPAYDTLHHIYMKRHCSKGKTVFKRGPPLFVFFYIYLYSFIVSLSFSFFFFLDIYFSLEFFSNDVIVDTMVCHRAVKRFFILNNRGVQGFFD